ncbi:endo-1,4-beta-xylanase [Patescibacteria group bacterium]|nr:endo-1,4-beta-xylanase [Patescibacteria group bacterium]MBU1896125.1 endo-1,4-beta-xylanase [Patescibacteria group bacterium]
MKFKKIMLILLIIFALVAILYALLWLCSIRKYPVEYGISFNQYHAESLGLDWQETYLAMLTDLKPKYVRIAAMWNEVESVQGQFDFTKVDWMMDKASEHNTKVTLVVGQKAPRWPECHVPEWSNVLSKDDYDIALLNYVSEVVSRYKDNDELELWQVENEPFIKFRFGECGGFQEELTYDEINLVRELDPNHKIIITDSGELSTWRKASGAGDLFGTTLYRVIRRPSGMILNYDWLPPAHYRFKAKFWGRSFNNFYISELQAEPWFTDLDVQNTTLSEQAKTMTPDRLEKNFDYASRVGASRAYLWGVEWWYWMRESKQQGAFWNLVREKITD